MENTTPLAQARDIEDALRADLDRAEARLEDAKAAEHAAWLATKAPSSAWCDANIARLHLDENSAEYQVAREAEDKLWELCKAVDKTYADAKAATMEAFRDTQQPNSDWVEAHIARLALEREAEATSTSTSSTPNHPPTLEAHLC